MLGESRPTLEVNKSNHMANTVWTTQDTGSDQPRHIPSRYFSLRSCRPIKGAPLKRFSYDEAPPVSHNLLYIEILFDWRQTARAIDSTFFIAAMSSMARVGILSWGGWGISVVLHGSRQIWWDNLFSIRMRRIEIRSNELQASALATCKPRPWDT
jgi:hypothetical protein